MLTNRANNAKFLTDGLVHLSDQLELPETREGSEHAFMMYPILVKSGVKTALCQHLER